MLTTSRLATVKAFTTKQCLHQGFRADIAGVLPREYSGHNPRVLCTPLKFSPTPIIPNTHAL